MIHDSIYNFTIDTNHCVYINDGISKTYTFPILSENQSYISENLIIQIKDNATNTFIFDYQEDINIIKSLSQQQIEQKEIKKYKISNSIFNEELFFRDEDATEMIFCYDKFIWDLVEYHEGDLTGGPLYEYEWVYVGTECYYASNGDGFSGSGTSGTTTGGTGGGSSSDNTISTIPSTIIESDGSSPGRALYQIFNDQLEEEQTECLAALSMTQQQDIRNYIYYLAENTANTSISASFQEIEDFMAAACGNTDLDLDFELSLKSPAYIDFSEIDKTTPEGQKFDCIYKKLAQSPSFKNLFIDTFGGTQEKLNIKFEIAEDLGNADGTCTSLPPNNGNYINLIRIDKKILSGNNEKSKFFIARVILHECIHAYLNIKKINCNLGTSIPELNGMDLETLIGTFYQGFGCHIDVNGSPQSQHDFMFTYLIPTFQNIFNEIRNLLATSNDILNAEGSYYNEINDSDFNWSWNDFYKYISLEGLHNTDTFMQNISQIPNENFYYNFYRGKSSQFSKTCQ